MAQKTPYAMVAPAPKSISLPARSTGRGAETSVASVLPLALLSLPVNALNIECPYIGHQARRALHDQSIAVPGTAVPGMPASGVPAPGEKEVLPESQLCEY